LITRRAYRGLPANIQRALAGVSLNTVPQPLGLFLHLRLPPSSVVPYKLGGGGRIHLAAALARVFLAFRTALAGRDGASLGRGDS